MSPFLFQPLAIKSVLLKNRLVVSPMCQYSSVDGFANSWHLVHLGTRAIGGAGLIFTEAAAVSPEGRITAQDLGIWKAAHVDGLRQITDFILAHGSVPGIQLAHAGRKASTRPPWEKSGPVTAPAEGGWTVVGPSAQPFSERSLVPVALDAGEIMQVVADFGHAARRAAEAGFKVVEIHAAHGYLIHQFLSPLSNLRTDEWGGSFENRIKLLLDILVAVKKNWPKELPVMVRISATDWTEGGWTPEDSVRLALLLQDRGVDLIDCSTGGNVPQAKIPVGPLYQVPFAAQIRKETGIATGAVGMINTAAEAEGILQEGKADLIFMARQLLRDPYFPLMAAKELGAEVAWPLQYERAKN